MDAARVMGTFLRVWRREWARLSRAQLAIAVQARCGGKQRVTRHVVEAWEEGQPPHSSEELVALLEEMEHHAGLHDSADAGGFRQWVFAACAARQYPALVASDDPAHHPNVDEIARGLYDAAGVTWTQIDLPLLVAFWKALEAAVADGRGHRLGPAQERRQKAALGFARAAVGACNSGARGRLNRWVADLLETNAEFLKTHFGPGGLGGPLSVLGQRTTAAFRLCHGTGSKAAIQRLFDLSEAAESRSEAGVGGDAYVKAVHCLAELELSLPAGADALAEARLEAATSVQRRDGVLVPHLDLVWAHLAAGQTDEAERFLQEFERWWALSPEVHVQWREARNWIAADRGDWDDIERRDGPKVVEECHELRDQGVHPCYVERLKRDRLRQRTSR